MQIWRSAGSALPTRRFLATAQDASADAGTHQVCPWSMHRLRWRLRDRVVRPPGAQSAASDLVYIAAQLPKGEPAKRLDSIICSELVGRRSGATSRTWGQVDSRKELAGHRGSISGAEDGLECVVNPLHPDVAKIKVEAIQPFHFDARMFGRLGSLPAFLQRRRNGRGGEPQLTP